MNELPEENSMWKEKVESDETEDQTRDPFVPAKLAEPFDPKRKVLIRGYNGSYKEVEQEVVVRIEL
jgi:hypothetical protein